MNFSHVFAGGNPVLILTFIFLIAMSFVSWYIIIWKSLRLRDEKRNFQEFLNKYSNIKDWPRHSDLKGLKGLVGGLLDEVQKLEPILVKHNHEDKKEILEMHLTQVLDEARIRLDKGLTALASIGSSAPFVGLFGTVWGIYNALTSIATQGSAGLSVVAGPMGEALVATAIGLFAAIPAILFYNMFVRLNRLLVQNLRHVAEQMAVYLSK